MIAILLAATLSHLASSEASNGAVETILRSKDQALLDAIGTGDRALWGRTLAHDAIYVDENGSIMDRAEYLKTLEPLPTGITGNISITQYRMHRHGNNAFVLHQDEEHENFHGQALVAHYLMTETWRLEQGQWKLSSAHVYVVNNDPPAIQLPLRKLAEYPGRYEAAPDLHYIVRLEDSSLMGGIEGGKLEPLFAEVADVFFLKGQPRKRLIFEHATVDGQVTSFASRREGHDVVWRRVP